MYPCSRYELWSWGKHTYIWVTDKTDALEDRSTREDEAEKGREKKKDREATARLCSPSSAPPLLLPVPWLFSRPFCYPFYIYVCHTTFLLDFFFYSISSFPDFPCSTGRADRGVDKTSTKSPSDTRVQIQTHTHTHSWSLKVFLWQKKRTQGTADQWHDF